MSRWPMFDKLGATDVSLPRVCLGDWPTPVHPIALSAARARLWLKRDDRAGGSYGGNKVRKLEAILADAVAHGHKAVWTLGAIGSHHCLATAIYAREHGLEAHVLHFPQPITAHVRENVRAIVSTGASLSLGWRHAIPIDMARQHVRNWLAGKDEAAYYIPGGGSSPLGAVGYVHAAFELAEQVALGECPEPTRIYVATGTCGTFVGLWLGCAMAGMRTEVIGVRVVDRLICNPPIVKRLAGKLVQCLVAHGVRVDEALLQRPIRLVQDQFGGEYGRPTPAGDAAVARMLDAGGPQLEGTYTGKGLAALLRDLDAGVVAGDVMFWDTYNSRSIAALVEATPVDAVPEAYQRFFEGPVEYAG